jgi:diguanylate cyclase (GGDEF)-like protein/PAS domain S-box-containing protein
VLSLTVLKLDESRLMAVLSDVTLSVLRERELRDSQAWTQAIAGSLTEHALLKLDPQGRVVAWNAGIGRLTGHDDALVGQPYARLHEPDGLPARLAQDRLDDALACGWSLDEGWLVRADGSRFWGSCLLVPLPPDADGDGSRARGFSLVLRDIGERSELTRELLDSVVRDHLTGLANRRAFFDAAQRELDRWARAPRPLSLVMIDVDHFKRINDRHGHAGGDGVLRHLAAGLTASSRALDIIARLGGEEFALLLPGVDAAGALEMAQRLCRVLAAQAVHVGEHRITCTVSAGVATMADDVDGVHGLLARADAALYNAKCQGRNRAVAWRPEPVATPVAP